MSSSADCEQIAALKATMARAWKLHAELLDHIAVLDQDQVALHVGYSSTSRLLAEVAAPDPRPSHQTDGACRAGHRYHARTTDTE